MKRGQKLPAVAAGALAFLTMASNRATADDHIKLAIGHGDTYDTAIPVLADRAGIFKKHGVSVDFFFTEGGVETLQAVIAGSADVGVGIGTLGVVGAFSKGAPLRIVSAEATGASDIYWFVPANSPIKSMRDISGKTVAFSAFGSSAYAIAQRFAEQFGVTPRLVPTGGPAATFTTVMSGQIDVGWGAAPFGLEAADKGDIRLLVIGNDIATFRDQTLRVNVAQASALEKRHDELARFMAAYKDAIDWMYESPDAVKWFAERAGVPVAIAIENRDKYTPKSAVQLPEIHGLDDMMRDAVAFKYIKAPMTKDQLSILIHSKEF